MGIEDQLMRMKRTMEELSQKRDRIVWETEQVQKEMKEQFGFNTVPAAEKELKKLEGQETKLEYELEKGIESIRKDHKTLLEMA
jgi:hypothetical protein